MRKLLDSEEKVKYSGFWAVIGMFWAFSAQAQMPYLDEVKALGAVAGQGMACGASKYGTFELLARAILISKAPSDKMQSEAVYTYNEAKANAYISKQMDGFFECDVINRRFDNQDIFKATLYRDGTIKMPHGTLVTPRQPYDATLVYNKDADVDAEAIYNGGGRQNVGEIRIKQEGSSSEVKAVYQPSSAEIAASAAVSERPAEVRRTEPAEDAGIGHIKSRWKTNR